jgi:tight adherence protein B
MTDPTLIMAAVFLGTLLLAGTVGGLVVVLGDNGQRKKRLQRAAGHRRSAVAGRGGPTAASLRRDDVQGRFRQVELLLRRIMPGRDKLRARIARAGLNMTFARYLFVCAAVAAAVGLSALPFVGQQLWPAALAIGLGAGWLLPRMVIGYLGGKRVKRFLQELPDAIDVMVRGLKSGLPVTETVGTVAKDFDGPVGQEFTQIDRLVRMGTNLEDALWDVAGRLDVPEFNFLAISVGLQRETGGNLTETLDNLSRLLRRRQQMRLKIKALSSEARASAYLLGALPFVMAGVLYLLNPDYMSRLFTDPFGHVLIGVGLTSELIGVGVMAKMVRFEI